jgi:hypothetical protein
MKGSAMFRWVFIAALVFGMNVPANGTGKRPCTKSEARQAEKDVDSLSNWDGVYRAYTKFSQCDDGAIAEGYSDAVGKLLADDWANFKRFLTLSKTDRGFSRFVVRHIDATLPKEILERISTNVQSACPAGEENVCRVLADASSRAITQGPHSQ